MTTTEAEELDKEGYFRTGRRPQAGFPFAEIYALLDADAAPEHWQPPLQERLPRPVSWNGAYFRRWAEAFVLAGEALPPAAWVIVVFAATGRIAACVEYRPVLRDGALMDVSCADAQERWVTQRRWRAPGSDSCHEPSCRYHVTRIPDLTAPRRRAAPPPCPSLPR